MGTMTSENNLQWKQKSQEPQTQPQKFFFDLLLVVTLWKTELTYDRNWIECISCTVLEQNL